MPIESATYISDLNTSYPAGTDQRSTADDHLRLIKATVKATFPNITGAVSATQAQLNQLAVTLTASRATVTDAGGVLASSAVTSTELGYVAGVTSALQTQLNGKQATITGAATTVTTSDLTVSRALASDGSGKIEVSSVTATELGYVSGVTSALQTQLDGKQATITGAATTITSSDLTASRALVSNGSGKVAVSTVTSSDLDILAGAAAAGLTSTELQYVKEVTSDIQTQINNTAGRRGAIAYRTTTQSIDTSADTNILFDAEVYDTDSIHSISTQTDLMVVPAGASKVRVSAFVSWAANNAGVRRIAIYKDGGYTPGMPKLLATSPSSSLAMQQTVSSAVISVVPGSFFAVVVYQNSGASLNVTNECWFSMEIIE